MTLANVFLSDRSEKGAAFVHVTKARAENKIFTESQVFLFLMGFYFPLLGGSNVTLEVNSAVFSH